MVVTAPPAAGSDGSSEVSRLRSQVEQQQQQIDSLRSALEEQRKLLEKVIGQAPATEEADHKAPNVGEVASTTPMVPLGAAPAIHSLPVPIAPAAQAVQPTQVPNSPLQLHIGDASITPIGFMDLVNTFRSTNSGASLATNFGSIPYNNTTGGRLSEDKFSAENSRIGFRVDAMAKNTRILGYFEGDFVGGQAANNTQVTSNSNLFRIRLYWVNLTHGKFEMLAGQSWSMLTPNRKAISALPGDLFYGQEYDVNYLNGLTWGRIPGIRFLYHPSNQFTMGLSFENAVQYFGGSGGGGVPTLPAALAGLGSSELDDSVANGKSLPNVHPDIIGKIAFEPNAHVHVEVAGVVNTVRLYNTVAPPYPGGNQHFTKSGGGVSVNANLEVFKNFRIVTNNFWSDGAGRYLFGVVPDFIVRADGSPSLIHAGSTVDGIEYTHKNTVFYAYYGGIYGARNTALDVNGSLIGYGYRGSPNSHNRTTQEVTGGLIQTFYRDPKYGAVQLMLQYAWFYRNPWYVAPGAPKSAFQNAVWANVRYTLPGAAPALTR
jgi:hypothetical protein